MSGNMFLNVTLGGATGIQRVEASLLLNVLQCTNAQDTKLPAKGVNNTEVEKNLSEMNRHTNFPLFFSP